MLTISVTDDGELVYFFPRVSWRIWFVFPKVKCLLRHIMKVYPMYLIKCNFCTVHSAADSDPLHFNKLVVENVETT